MMTPKDDPVIKEVQHDQKVGRIQLRFVGGTEFNQIQSCAEQSSHENPLEPDDYAKPGQNLKMKIF